MGVALPLALVGGVAEPRAILFEKLGLRRFAPLGGEALLMRLSIDVSSDVSRGLRPRGGVIVGHHSGSALLRPVRCWALLLVVELPGDHWIAGAVELSAGALDLVQLVLAALVMARG